MVPATSQADAKQIERTIKTFRDTSDTINRECITILTPQSTEIRNLQVPSGSVACALLHLGLDREHQSSLSVHEYRRLAEKNREKQN